MTDEFKPLPEAIKEAEAGRIASAVAAVLRFIPDPNRTAIYLSVVGDILAAVLVIVGNLQVPEVVAVLTTVAAVNAKTLMFLRGWQNMETADYQAQLETRRHYIAMEQHAAASNVGRPGSGPRVKLPR